MLCGVPEGPLADLEAPLHAVVVGRCRLELCAAWSCSVWDLRALWQTWKQLERTRKKQRRPPGCLPNGWVLNWEPF